MDMQGVEPVSYSIACCVKARYRSFSLAHGAITKIYLDTYLRLTSSRQDAPQPAVSGPKDDMTCIERLVWAVPNLPFLLEINLALAKQPTTVLCAAS